MFCATASFAPRLGWPPESYELQSKDQFQLPNEVLPKPAYRPPVGIPTRDPRSARPTIAAALLHALIVALILLPPLVSAHNALDARNKAAGGPGPAGGGGGGTLGDGSLTDLRERLRFMVLPKDPLTQPPIPIPTPPRVEPKKEEVKPAIPPPVPAPAPLDSAAPQTATSSDSAAGSGGTGRDGTAGNGPGSGGGVGSGTGTGRGSGTGPGTGGGEDEIYGAQVVALPILPIPVPAKVRPYRLVAYFDVDTLGNATLISFNASNDSRYNRRVREMLLEMRFRPAVRRNGTPVRDTVTVKAEAL
jgi:protein TonB